MKLTRLPRRRPCTLLMIFGISLLPVLCGALVIVQQIDRTLDAGARNSAVRALYVVDRVFDTLREASSHIAQAPRRNCAELAPRLLGSIDSSQLVRSLVLKQADDSVCSSSAWELASKALFDQFAYQRISLTAQGSTSARDGALVFAWEHDNQTLLAAIDGQRLHRQLSKFAEGEVLQLDMGDHSIWMSKDGYAQTRTGPRPSNRFSKRSPDYDYTVYAGYGAGTFQHMFWAYSARALPLLMLIGLLTGAGVYLVLLRGHRGVQQVPS